jgi:hypothetical protein
MSVDVHIVVHDIVEPVGLNSPSTDGSRTITQNEADRRTQEGRTKSRWMEVAIKFEVT